MKPIGAYALALDYKLINYSSQILDMLAEILDGAGLHTVDDAGQRDRVQVRLKDCLLYTSRCV